MISDGLGQWCMVFQIGTYLLHVGRRLGEYFTGAFESHVRLVDGDAATTTICSDVEGDGVDMTECTQKIVKEKSVL